MKERAGERRRDETVEFFPPPLSFFFRGSQRERKRKRKRKRKSRLKHHVQPLQHVELSVREFSRPML